MSAYIRTCTYVYTCIYIYMDSIYIYIVLRHVYMCEVLILILLSSSTSYSSCNCKLSYKWERISSKLLYTFTYYLASFSAYKKQIKLKYFKYNIYNNLFCETSKLLPESDGGMATCCRWGCRQTVQRRANTSITTPPSALRSSRSVRRLKRYRSHASEM